MVTAVERNRRTYGYEYDVVEEEVKNPGFGVRHVQMLLMFLAIIISFGIRVCMSIAIVAMTTKTAENEDSQSVVNWNKQVQTAVLTSFFVGYMVTQIPAGVAATRFGGRPLIGIGLFVNGMLCLLLPKAVTLGGWKVLCAIRILQGLTQGFLYPSINTLLGKWAPLSERSRLANFVYSAGPIGTVIGMPISGLLASSSFGWASVFYMYGSMAVLFTVFWVYFSSRGPAHHKHISEEEKSFIQESLEQTEDNLHNKGDIMITPWRSILTSVPLMALCVSHIGCNYGFMTLFLLTPTYMKDIHQIDIQKSGLLSALPYIAMSLMSVVCSFIADYLVNKELMSLTDVRKLANTVGTFCPALALVLLCMLPPDCTVIAIVLVIASVGLSGASMVGFLVNHLDLSPNFAGIMYGMTNMMANLFGSLGTSFAGFIITETSTTKDWNILFYMVAGIYVATNVIFLIFGSAEKQPWNEPVYKEKKVPTEERRS